MKTERELFENALDTTSVNGKKLREYINENYISNSVLDKIRAEIKTLSPEPTAYDVVDGNPVKDAIWETLIEVDKIIDKYKVESESMTREEAIEEIRYYCQNSEDIIKALEQEPCEDCVNRQAVVEYIKASDADLGHDSENDIVVEDILDMLPVTPKDVTVTDFADKCKECGARHGKQLKKLERIKARYNEERAILLNSSLEYTPNNVLDIIDYVIHGD